MKRKKTVAAGVLVVGILFAGLCVWRLYGRGETAVTPSALKKKYENTGETVKLENTLYGVSKKQEFSYDFACDVSEAPALTQERLVTVHTDRACKEESRLVTGLRVEKKGTGSLVTVYPLEQALRTKADKSEGESWGSAPVYYIAVWYDRDAGEMRRLDKPCVIPFTLKSDCRVPNLQADIREDGVFRLTWNEIEGADEYRIYNYVTSDTISGGENRETDGALCGYQNGYLSYEGSTGKTVFEGFSGGEKNEVAINSHKSGKSFVIGQNYHVQGEYYVTSVVDGKESVLSNAVRTSGLQLPKQVKEDSDILYNRYGKVSELPLSLPVENIDGSVQDRKVLYTLSEEKGAWGEKQPHYRYRIEGTGLTGYVVMEGSGRGTGNSDETENGGKHYPETVGTPSLAGERIPEDRADKVPQTEKWIEGAEEAEKQTEETEEAGKQTEEAEVPALDSAYYIQADSAAQEWLALNLIAGQKKIYIGDFPELTEPDSLRRIFYRVYYQNPYVFGIEAFRCDYESLTFEVSYIYSQREREQMRREMTEAARGIIEASGKKAETEADKKEADTDAEGNASSGAEEQLRRLYDRLEEHAGYDRNASLKTRENSYRKEGGEAYESAHNAYGVLVLGKGMCQSYADAFLLLCHMSGIEAAAVSGYMNQSLPHVWNRVKLGGMWYYVDVTNNERNTGVPYYLFLAGAQCAEGLQYVPDTRAAEEVAEGEAEAEREAGLAADETREYYTRHGLALKTASAYLPVVEKALRENTHKENTRKENVGIPVVRRENGVSEQELAAVIRQVFQKLGRQQELENYTWQSVGKYFLVK